MNVLAIIVWTIGDIVDAAFWALLLIAAIAYCGVIAVRDWVRARRQRRARRFANLKLD